MVFEVLPLTLGPPARHFQRNVWFTINVFFDRSPRAVPQAQPRIPRIQAPGLAMSSATSRKLAYDASCTAPFHELLPDKHGEARTCPKDRP
uniref:Uncharacterized protein n=1 Tax=mine drainage metagenome TaxID=410659 RepID=E6PPU0_9ZZZZ